MAKNKVVVRKSFGRLALYISGNKDWLSKLAAKLHEAEWDRTIKCWTVPNNKLQLDEIFRVFKNRAWVDIKALSNKPVKHWEPAGERSILEMVPAECPSEFVRFLTARNYSSNTIKTYTSLLKTFIYHNQAADHREMGAAEIKAYIQHLIHHKKASVSYQNQTINALKCYYENILGRDKMFIEVERPMKEKKLPEVFSESELMRIFRSIKNIKHRAMILLVYSAGLRAGELTALKISDIKSDRMEVFIRGGKGKKDRLSILSMTCLKTLRQYFQEYKPVDYLFEGQYGDRYSQTSLRNVFKKAIRKAGIRRNATLHTLRHSFATHLLERNVNLRYIQHLLGHNSPKTTEIYTHITNKGIDDIVNPLDQMDI